MLGDRIIGGQDAEQHEFPWAALLTINGRERCGGNLLNDRYVLTSAHCLVHVREDDIDVEVKLGEHNTEERDDGELTVLATSILRHPRYLQTRRGLEVDLALAVVVVLVVGLRHDPGGDLLDIERKCYVQMGVWLGIILISIRCKNVEQILVKTRIIVWDDGSRIGAGGLLARSGWRTSLSDQTVGWRLHGLEQELLRSETSCENSSQG